MELSINAKHSVKELMLRNIPPIKDELFAQLFVLFAKMFAALTARRAHAAALKLHHFTNLSMIRKKCYLQSIPNTLELSLNIVTKAYNCLSLHFFTKLRWQATETTSSKTHRSSLNQTNINNGHYHIGL